VAGTIVRTAAALSLADHLAEHPATAKEIAAAEGSDLSATFRLLRACTAPKLVTYESATGRIAGTALLETLRRDSPHTLRSLALEHTAPARCRSWGHFTDSVRAGFTQFEATLGSASRPIRTVNGSASRPGGREVDLRPD
jgi:hypothetical protein